MEYSFPPEFPQKSRNLVLAESICAAKDFERARQEARFSSAVEALLRNYILRVFIVFVREAGELGRQRLWSAVRVESESREFLRRCTILVQHEKGYDRSRNRLGEMVSHWDGSILPDVYRGFEQSPEWKEYEDILLAVGDAQAVPRKDESQLSQAETAGVVGIDEPLKIKQAETLGPQRVIAPMASHNLAKIEELREEQGAVLQRPCGGLRRKPVRRNPKYEEIDNTLRRIAQGRPTSHAEVFRALDGRARIPNAEPFESAGGWMSGFRRDKVSARTWLSKSWSRLNLPAFRRGPK